MRTEIAILAGPREWGDTRQRWLSRVPATVKKVLGTETETVSYRMVKSLWYGVIENPEHHAARDVKRAAQLIEAQRKALDLAETYQRLIGGLNAAEPTDQLRVSLDRLEHMASKLRSLAPGM